ncbi:hypothetical protein ACWJJH_08035 [Endozoicomonadaceae bacterium StTr2]
MSKKENTDEFDLQAQIDATNKLLAEAQSAFARQAKLQQQLGLNPAAAEVYEEKLQPSEVAMQQALSLAASQGGKPEKKGKRKRNSGLLKAVTRQGRI